MPTTVVHHPRGDQSPLQSLSASAGSGKRDAVADPRLDTNDVGPHIWLSSRRQRAGIRSSGDRSSGPET